MGIGDVEFKRIEEVSKDILRIALLYSAGSNYYWNDVDCAVQYVGTISNCAGTIEVLYISEQGKFYNQNHKLIAENEEDFFDYITTVEYDFHPEILNRTYHILRHFGWYEGRHIDTSEFEQKMKKRGIEFTKAQLNFLSEFGDLSFLLPGVVWNFSSLSDILEHYTSMPVNPGKQSRIITEHAFACGFEDGGVLYLTVDGLIATSQNNPLGRTTMECINHLCNYTTENDPWLDNLLKHNEAEDLKQSF
ncbi:MAG: SUKH-3 domain-containing protein [Oscillospiraceae bacterium]|nr:SUKH-3 domain-containing protein [Oscillospiraceae bacterium]